MWRCEPASFLRELGAEAAEQFEKRHAVVHEQHLKFFLRSAGHRHGDGGLAGAGGGAGASARRHSWRAFWN